MIAVCVAYAALTALVVVGSPLDRVDQFFYDLHLAPRPSSTWSSVNDFVQIGDGVPVSTIAALYAIWRSVTTRSWTPWVKFGIALFLLNTSVGAMKHLTGRLGPSATDVVHTVWAGGTIFPSGHAANATVMFGLMAIIAPAAHRRVLTRVAVTMATLIGLGTIVLNTHWVSDVLGGWLAGGLVLLMLTPWTPPLDRLVTRTARRLAPTAFDWSVALLLPPLTPKSARRSRPAGAMGHLAGPPAGSFGARPALMWADLGHRHSGAAGRPSAPPGRTVTRRRRPSGPSGFDNRGPPARHTERVEGLVSAHSPWGPFSGRPFPAGVPGWNPRAGIPGPE